MIMEEVLGLSLANGIKLGFVPGDEPTSLIISRLREIMQLSLLKKPTHKIIFLSDNYKHGFDYASETFLAESPKLENLLLENNYGSVFCKDRQDTLISSLSDQFIRTDFYKQLSYICVNIHLITQCSGGLFLHGALAEKNNCGVIFAGNSGVGKTTAVNRLPNPWRPLCDETTLVVRDGHGAYWAHPMPTRSRFIRDKSGGTWNVQHAVPLKGICLLLQDENDRLCPIKTAEATYLVTRFAEQALSQIFFGTEYTRGNSLLKKIFDNSYDLAKSIPVYILKLSLRGEFWNQLDAITI
jgi:SynChlorMet cassette protein ScmC